MAVDVPIPAGRVQVATPATMAASIRNNTEATEAVDERIEGVATEIISSDPSIKAAAAEAVGDAVTDADLVGRHENVVMQEEASDGVVWAVTDSARRSPLYISESGSVHAARLKAKRVELASGTIQDTNAEYLAGYTVGGRATELVVDGRGRVPEWAARRIVERGMSGAANKLAVWGDSITESGASWSTMSGGNAGDDWPTQLSNLLGWTVYNGGYWGQTTARIAARQGGTPLKVTVDGGVIPATGSVVVSGIPNGDHPLLANYTSERRFMLAGRRGLLVYLAPTTATFIVDPGEAVAVTEPVTAWPLDGLAMRDWDQIIATGRNGANIRANHDAIIAKIRDMTEFTRGRTLVVTSPIYRSELGANTAASIFEFNAKLRNEFAETVDPWAFLRTDTAFAIAGLTPTAQDNTDRANNLTPLSFSADGVHPNAAARKVLAEFYKRVLTEGNFANVNY